MPYSPAGVPAASAAIAALQDPQNTPIGGVGANIQSQNVIKTLYDYDPFSILTDVQSRHSRKTSYFRIMLEAMGMSRGVSAPTTGHYEEMRLEQTVKIGSIVTASTGAGTSAVVALHADSMYTYSPGQTASGVAVQSSGVREGDIILLGGGTKAYVSVKNTTVNPHRLTLVPVKTTGDLAAKITANSSYSILTNAWGEGTGLPAGKLPRIFKYTNEFQIVKESFGGTGTAGTDKLFVSFDRAADGSIFGVLNRDAVDRFERNVSNALLFGSTINNVTQFNAELGIDIPVKGTEGAIDFIETQGHIPTYSVGAYDLGDYDSISTIMTAEGAGTNVLYQMMGHGVYLQIENMLLNTNINDTSPFLMKQFAEQQNLAADSWQPFQDSDFGFYVGFKAIKKGGYTFAMQEMPEFNDPTLGGNAEYTWNATVITAPIGSKKNMTDGSPSMMFGCEHKELAGYSRKARFGTYFGVGAKGLDGFEQASNQYDYSRAGMLSEIAFHGSCPNLGIIQKPA